MDNYCLVINFIIAVYIAYRLYVVLVQLLRKL